MARGKAESGRFCGPSAFSPPRPAAACVVFTGGSPLRVPPVRPRNPNPIGSALSSQMRRVSHAYCPGAWGSLVGSIHYRRYVGIKDSHPMFCEGCGLSQEGFKTGSSASTQYPECRLFPQAVKRARVCPLYLRKEGIAARDFLVRRRPFTQLLAASRRQAADTHHGPARRSNRTSRHVRGGTQASARRHAATRGVTTHAPAQSSRVMVAVRHHDEILLPKSLRSPSLHASSRRIGRKT
jgi:hypothetical protein